MRKLRFIAASLLAMLLVPAMAGNGKKDEKVLYEGYVYRMNVPKEEQLREAMIIPADSITPKKIDNRIKYSDHYPVFVRLLYKGKNH